MLADQFDGELLAIFAGIGVGQVIETGAVEQTKQFVYVIRQHQSGAAICDASEMVPGMLHTMSFVG